LALAFACQAVARFRPRAPPSRSAPSHRPVRARAEAAARRSRSLGSGAAVAAASRRVPGERRRWRRPGAGRSAHLPRPARWRLVSVPPSPIAVPDCLGPYSRCCWPSLPRNTCCCSLSARGGDTATDVLAGEEAAPPGRSRPSVLGPSGEGSKPLVARPGLRAAAMGRQALARPALPGTRGLRVRRGCVRPVVLFQCLLRVVAQLGDIPTVGGQAPVRGWKRRRPRLFLWSSQSLGGTASPPFELLWKPAYYLVTLYLEDQVLSRVYLGNVSRGDVSTQNPFAINSKLIF
jgi:hypothetical protein